jgi:hypothetical protein
MSDINFRSQLSYYFTSLIVSSTRRWCALVRCGSSLRSSVHRHIRRIAQRHASLFPTLAACVSSNNLRHQADSSLRVWASYPLVVRGVYPRIWHDRSFSLSSGAVKKMWNLTCYDEMSLYCLLSYNSISDRGSYIGVFTSHNPSLTHITSPSSMI